tara:strand:- start:146 stop:502 length:357 start_codon:yes stop_codon:yes gene_type:complete
MALYAKTLKLIIEDIMITALYVGKTRKDVRKERGNPNNSLIRNLIQSATSVGEWTEVMTISESEVNPQFGEAYFKNCAQEEFASHDAVIPVNMGNPHGGAFGFDTKSKIFVDKLKKII